jgi:alkylation response protein AidB-like acyl-CoA dehydrogenase
VRFAFTEAQDEFRAEVREFLRSEIEAGVFSVQCGDLIRPGSREFSRKMAERGWIGMTWPREYGGRGRPYVEKAILMEELLRVQAPIGYHFLADRQVGPALIHFGSDWQKEHFLPRIVRADPGVAFCLLFSEPNAGSDLAGVTTTAVRDGDDYIVNGQKVWTSAAHAADFGWLLAKTDLDPAAGRYESASEFIVDMKTPGITVRPIVNMAGQSNFNEVFFEDARIPAKCLVGEENAGFKQIMAQMDYERAGLERLMQNFPLFERLKQHLRDKALSDEPEGFRAWARDQVAQLEIEYGIGRLLCYHTAWTIDQGQKPTTQAAMCKAFCTQYEQRVNDVASKILGPVCQIRGGAPWSVLGGDVAESLLWGPSYTLQGGSVEVLKNIVALRGLGLPRK